MTRTSDFDERDWPEERMSRVALLLDLSAYAAMSVWWSVTEFLGSLNIVKSSLGTSRPHHLAH